MIKKILFAYCVFLVTSPVMAQPTFKVGWNTYKTGIITHQYTYKYTYTDSTVLLLTDTLTILATADSMVTLCVRTPMRERCTYKTANYLNAKKQVVKCEEYKDEALLSSKEWKYDEKNRKYQHIEENKTSGNNFKKNYDYANDKNGDLVMTESAYYNGRIEFYTKSYYDSRNQKYKEVRLNDNNKDIIHVESYTYGENGRVKERSVFFPEFKVTKKFTERDGDVPLKCFRIMPLGTVEKPSFTTAARIPFIKRVLVRNQAVIYDKDCNDFDYKFTNHTTCEVLVSTTKTPNVWQVIYRTRERVQ